MATIMLTNKSGRVYDTSQGKFRPGISKEFNEKEAIRLLGYVGEIVRTEDALGADSKKLVAAKDKAIKDQDKKIAEMEGFIRKVKEENDRLKGELKGALARPGRR